MSNPRTKLKLSEEEKKELRREQKKRCMRQKRAKLDAAAIEERRKNDRERYQRKKENGLITTIHDLSSREQQQIRKTWREKTKRRREKQKIEKWGEKVFQENTPSTASSSFSRVAIAAQTKLVIDALKVQNTLVSLVRKGNSPNPVSNTESFPASDNLDASVSSSGSEATSPTKLTVTATIKEENEL